MDDSRRRFLALFPGLLLAKVSKEQIARAEELAGVHFDDAQREMMKELLDDAAEQLAKLHELKIDNSVAPALVFDPLPPGAEIPKARPKRGSRPSTAKLPSSEEEIAFLPAARLGELIKLRKISSLELTRLYIAPLPAADKQHDCVETLPEIRELAQANIDD